MIQPWPWESVVRATAAHWRFSWMSANRGLYWAQLTNESGQGTHNLNSEHNTTCNGATEQSRWSSQARCWVIKGTLDCVFTRDSKGISKLPWMQHILPYKVGCIRGSLEIPLLSLVYLLTLGGPDHEKFPCSAGHNMWTGVCCMTYVSQELSSGTLRSNNENRHHWAFE